MRSHQIEGGAPTVYFTVNLLKAGDGWKVLNFDSSETDPSSDRTTDGVNSTARDPVNSSTLG